MAGKLSASVRTAAHAQSGMARWPLNDHTAIPLTIARNPTTCHPAYDPSHRDACGRRLRAGAFQHYEPISLFRARCIPQSPQQEIHLLDV